MPNNCPGCGRPIDEDDDEIVSKPGPLGQEEWHEECALNPPEVLEIEEIEPLETEKVEPLKIEVSPESPATIPPQPKPLIETKKEKKMPKKAKKLTQDEVNALLIKEVQRLTDAFAKMQATPLKEVAAAPAPKKKSTKGQPRPDAWYVIRGFPTEKYPPQCLRVMRCLAQAAPEGGRMSEVEVFNALVGPDTTIGPWPYRQDAFYIFRYYKCPMIDGDYLLGPYFVG